MKLNFLSGSALAKLRAFSYGDHPRPERDWLLLIAFAGVLLLASAGWSYWLFLSSGNGPATGSAAAPASVNAASLDTVRAVFDARAAERAHYLNDYRFVDPSH